MSYTLRKEEEEEEADGGEILGGTGYGRWGRVFLFSKSTPSCDADTTQNCCPFWYRSIATKSEVTRFLNVPLDVSDVFIMTFMILLDSYMEPTRVGSDKARLLNVFDTLTCSLALIYNLTHEWLNREVGVWGKGVANLTAFCCVDQEPWPKYQIDIHYQRRYKWRSSDIQHPSDTAWIRGYSYTS